MLLDDLHTEFATAYDGKDLQGAKSSIFKALGYVMTESRPDFIELMRQSGVQGDLEQLDDNDLINLYMDHLPENKDLKLGSAMIINMNASSGFDGTGGVKDSMVKACYHTLTVYFASPSENYYSASGIGAAISEASKLGQQIVSGARAKKQGIIDTASKKEEAKQEMAKMVLSQRQAQIEAAKKRQEQNAKTTRTVLIVGSIVVVGSIMGILIWKLKSKKK